MVDLKNWRTIDEIGNKKARTLGAGQDEHIRVPLPGRLSEPEKAAKKWIATEVSEYLPVPPDGCGETVKVANWLVRNCCLNPVETLSDRLNPVIGEGGTNNHWS